VIKTLFREHSFSMSVIVELSPDDLIEAGRTAEIVGAQVLRDGRNIDWFVRSGDYPAWAPEGILTCELPPPKKKPRYPGLAIVLVGVVMAMCITVVAFAATVMLASPAKAPSEVLSPPPPVVHASRPEPKIETPIATPAPTIPTIDVTNLPKSKARR